MLGDARRRRQPGPFRDHSSTAQARVHGGALALERPGRRTRGGARPRRPRGAPGVVAPPSDRRCGPCSRATSAWLAPSSRSPASRRTPSLEAGRMPSCGDLPPEGKRSDQRGTPRGHNYLGRNASPERAAASLGYVMARVGWLALSCAKRPGTGCDLACACVARVRFCRGPSAPTERYRSVS